MSAQFSLNLAISAAVCLVSRLPTSNHAFAMLSLAVILFAQWPLLRLRLMNHYPCICTYTLPIVSTCCTIGCWYQSIGAAIAYLLLHAIICAVVPCLLISMQHLKRLV